MSASASAPGLDNGAVARVLGEIADLLELKGDNAFKIRAYRNAAELVKDAAERVAARTEVELRAWPGIGKDLAARLREIATSGTCGIHQALLAEFPPTLLDLLRLQGLGPKTAALLYRELRIASLDDLEAAARNGRLRALKGMGARKEALLLRALEERRQHLNRHLLAHTVALAESLVGHLRARTAGVTFDIVGSVRRGTETCGDLDILATPEAAGASVGAGVVEALCAYRRVERVLARGDTKVSVLIAGGYQADLRLIESDSRGAALQYFTGSKAHNIALRDRALARGLRLNEYGLFRASDDTRLAGASEAEVYEALGLAWIPPELREQRGEIEAALEGRLPNLVAHGDLRGDLHMHTAETDGKETLEGMVQAARDAGLGYIAITDHSQSLAMANGLDERRALAHAARIRELDARMEGIRVLAGIECDILPDGSMDLADDCLAALDFVIASVHSAMRQDEAAMTARILRAIENPWVDVIGHPTSRMLLRREPARFDIAAIIGAAAANGVALEINGQAHRLDLPDPYARLARERGVKLIVSSDAHSRAELANTRWGILVARRAWATKADVLNTLPYRALRRSLRRNRRTAS
jgi:DNA polymerase (family 10)